MHTCKCSGTFLTGLSFVDILNRKTTVYNPAKRADEVFWSCVWSYCPNPWEFAQMIEAVCTDKMLYAMHSTVHTIYPALTSVFTVLLGQAQTTYEQQQQRIPTAEATMIEYHRQAQKKSMWLFLSSVYLCGTVCVWHQVKPQKRRRMTRA